MGVLPLLPPNTQNATADISGVAGACKDGHEAVEMPNGIVASAPIVCVEEENEQFEVEPEMMEREVSIVGEVTASHETLDRMHTVRAFTVPS